MGSFLKAAYPFTHNRAVSSMALPANTTIEVRATGNDSNGGGFVAGSSGTDYSQQNSAQFSGTDLVSTSGTTNPSVVTSASHSFVSTDVGNLIQITAGTNWTPGFYQIVSVSSGAATLDRAVGTNAALSGGTWALGGALATPQKAFTNFIASSVLSSDLGVIIYIKAATYTTASGFTTGITGSSTGTPSRIVGYSTTRGDGGQATLQLSANNETLFTYSVPGTSNASYSFENIIWDGNNQTNSNGLNLGASNVYVIFFNCVFKNFTYQFVFSGSSVPSYTFQRCDFLNNALTASTAYVLAAGIAEPGIFVLESCYFANNSGSGTLTGIICPGSGDIIVENTIFYNNTGTNFSILKSSGMTLKNCVFHSNAGTAIDNSTLYSSGHYIGPMIIQNSIFTNNGGYGIIIDMPSSTMVLPAVMNNAFYNNTSGNQSGYTSMGGDVAMTGLPYNNAPTDFGLNNTAGAGAACRGAAIPGPVGSASVVGTGYLDIGAVQHECATGSFAGVNGQWFGV